MSRGTNPRAQAPGSRRLAAVALTLVAALPVAACGSSSSSSSSSSGARSSSGKSLTLGTKNFTEQFVIGELYRQVLRAHGYQVNYKENIGATEVVDKALTSGQIDAYPEYTGESVSTVARLNQTVTSPQEEYNLAKAFYARRGQAMSDMTPFYDTDAVAVLKTYAQQHGLKTIADLAKVPHFVLGGLPEFLDRQQGAEGMRTVYGVNNFSFKSLAGGLNYQALNTGGVNAADVFTTDPQLASGRYTLLADPKNIFGFQNVALIINKSKLSQLGGAKFLSLINKVNSTLTNSAMIAMNKAVAIDKQSPATVAHAFLQANRLL